MKVIINLIVLAIICLCSLSSFGGDQNCDSIQRTFYVGESYTGPEVCKKIPFYKFKSDLRGTFLKQFCDTLANNDFFSILTLNEVQDLHIHHEGSAKDYVYLQSEWMDSTLFQNTNGAIALSGKELLLFRNISDSTIASLHIEEVDSLTIIYGIKKDNLFSGINDSELSALLYFRPDGSVDPVLIYLICGSINNHPSLSKHFDWIKPFYAENGINFTPGYITQRDLFEYIFYNEDIPREESFENGRLFLIFSFNDILRIKNWRFPFERVKLPVIYNESTDDE